MAENERCGRATAGVSKREGKMSCAEELLVLVLARNDGPIVVTSILLSSSPHFYICAVCH